MTDDFTIDFARGRVPVPEPLSNTERTLLRDLAHPGLPLWKVLRELDDYREGLKEALVDVKQDIEDPEIRAKWRQVQNAAGAITQVLAKFEAALTLEQKDERA